MFSHLKNDRYIEKCFCYMINYDWDWKVKDCCSNFCQKGSCKERLAWALVCGAIAHYLEQVGQICKKDKKRALKFDQKHCGLSRYIVTNNTNLKRKYKFFANDPNGITCLKYINNM